MSRCNVLAARWILAAAVALIAGCSRQAADLEAHSPALAQLLGQYEAQVRARPGDAIARAELALCYEANGRWAQAAAHYLAAGELDPAQPMWPTHAAHSQAQHGELEAARRTLELAAARFPDSAALLQRWAVTCLENGDYSKARDQFLVLTTLAPSEGWTGVAEVDLAMGDTVGALRACESALVSDPNYKLTRFLRARSLRELGRESEAARELQFFDVTTRRMLADTWFDRAAEFEMAFEARFARAVGLLNAERAVPAVAAFEALLKERPADVRSLANLSMARAAAGDLEGALADCERAIRLDPRRASLHRALALVLFRTGSTDESIESARRACELDAADGQNFALLGNLMGARQDFLGALDAWRKSLRLDPSQHGLRLRIEALEKR